MDGAFAVLVLSKRFFVSVRVASLGEAEDSKEVHLHKTILKRYCDCTVRASRFHMSMFRRGPAGAAVEQCLCRDW